MKYYPVCLDLRQRSCLVFGGGPVAERKTLSLLEAEAEVTVVSPALNTGLAALAGSGTVVHHSREFDPSDLGGSVFLVIAATNSLVVNRTIAGECRKRGILVNAASPPEASTFIVPSLVRRGDLLIAVSTSGASPALSASIRRELEQQYGPEYELFLSRLAGLRARLQETVADEAGRKGLLESVIRSDVLDMLRSGSISQADSRIREITGLPPPPADHTAG